MTPTENIQRDRDMILSPLKWPHFVLPLKRGNFNDPDGTAVFAPPLGVEKVDPAEPITVYLATMFNFKNAPTKTYTDVDALLDDGWRVD